MTVTAILGEVGHRSAAGPPSGRAALGRVPALGWSDGDRLGSRPPECGGTPVGACGTRVRPGTRVGGRRLDLAEGGS